MVTFYDADRHDLYLQDEFSGIYLDTHDVPVPTPLPDFVLLEATTVFSTNQERRLKNVMLHPLPDRGIPIDRPVNLAGLFEQTNGSCMVRVHGLVRSYYEDDRLCVRLEVEGKVIPVYILNHKTSELAGLLGAKVRVEGVCSQEYESGRITGTKLLVRNLRTLHFEQPGVRDPFNAPLVSPRDLITGNPLPSTRVRIKGEVTAQASGEWIELGENLNAVRVLIPIATADLRGKTVEATGLARSVEGRICLVDATVRETSPDGKGNSLGTLAAGGALRRIKDIKTLLVSEAARSIPVDVEGIVTYWDPGWQNLFVSDGTNGIYVETGRPLDLKPGQRLSIKGTTVPSDATPFIAQSSITVLGAGPELPPMTMNYDAGMSGTNDCRWVQIEGMVERYDERDGHYFLDVVTQEGGRFSCWIARLNDSAFVSRLTNWVVRLQGICANQLGENRRIEGFTIRVMDERWITCLTAATPVEATIDAINGPVEKSARFTVRGIVSLALPTDVYVQDQTGGIHFRPASLEKVVKPGDEVIVTGTRESIEFLPILNNASVTVLRRGLSLRPKEGRTEAVLNGGHEAELVRVTAELLEDVSGTNGVRFYALDGDLEFQACLHDPPDNRMVKLRQGMVVRLTGVSVSKRVDLSRIGARQLWLRSADDIQVVWNPPAAMNWQRILIGAAVVTCLLLAGLAWVVMLRRQVKLQTRQISDRLEREAALENRLRQAQKMESIGQLAAGVAHDFNNLLTVIQGHSCLLAETKMTRDARESAEQIGNAAMRAGELTRQLLTFSRQQPMQIELFDLNDAVESISKLLDRLIGDDISLKLVKSAKLPLIKGDRGMVHQVLMNLAVNARDAMPSGGRLDIETGVRVIELGATHASGEARAGEFVRLTVRDTGVGMTKEVARRIFEPFFTTKETGKGTGLGLATVYGIVQQHRGWIDVESEPGRGTVFDVYFPVFSAEKTERLAVET